MVTNSRLTVKISSVKIHVSPSPPLSFSVLPTQQEEWDKNIPEVSLFRVLALNAKEWWMIGLGLLGSIVTGSIYPLFAIVFGYILEVFTLPADEIFNEIHLWAGLFLVLGLVSGVAIFLKVCVVCVYTGTH